MTEPTSTAALAFGLKAGLGVVGAAMLYMLMPPGRPKGEPTSRQDLARELGIRFTFAGITSAAVGDWVVDLVQTLAPWLLAAKHPTPFLMAAGALGWYVGRAVALYLYRRQDKDLAEWQDELRRRTGQ